jgi:excinuclease ABC subunit A
VTFFTALGASAPGEPAVESGSENEEMVLTEKEREVARRILKEIRERLGFLVNVGLEYLTLDRTAATLAGGEGQRIRLATQIGSSLVGVLYILDEPSVGLHQRDNVRLLNTLKRLRDLGNTVLVVEHDEETIRSADYVIDLGPGAGVSGGRVVASGTPQEIIACRHSLTGRYLSGELSIPVPRIRRPPSGDYLTIVGAREHNLKNIDVEIPLGLFTCVTGVSGSGKSTLVTDILRKALDAKLYGGREHPGVYDKILGVEHIDKVIDIDQAPIGRTPRSNPATYTGVFAFIRELFALTPEARMRGYQPGRFSFNVKGGRCEACQGDGLIQIEMHFLPDVYVTCDVCKGKRYNRETLEIRYKGGNIADALDMTVEEALRFFENVPRIKEKLQTLYDVGLGYIKLGQSATTLSGGEAQRVKLSRELSRRSTGRTLYILDEPTTGLHFADIQQLLDVLHRLRDAGNTVLVIEHNMDVVKTADYVIDLGPEGGDDGGRIVATGSPEEVTRIKGSYTGQFLKRVLRNGKGRIGL